MTDTSYTSYLSRRYLYWSWHSSSNPLPKLPNNRRADPWLKTTKTKASFDFGQTEIYKMEVEAVGKLSDPQETIFLEYMQTIAQDLKTTSQLPEDTRVAKPPELV